MGLEDQHGEGWEIRAGNGPKRPVSTWINISHIPEKNSYFLLKKPVGAGQR